MTGEDLHEQRTVARAAASRGTIGDALSSGTLLAQRYRIVGKLGSGGMGSVYRAEDLELGEQVALKFLGPALAGEQGIAMLRREVKVARQITHRNVCRVHDLGEVEGRPFLSMEYVDGEDLGALLQRIGRLPSAKAVQFARQVCAGLHAAHERGVLHRDLKPANVMIDGRGNARITDFGIAAAAAELREGDSVAGTPGYMAPELFTGGNASVQSDLFSLGLVLYETCTGHPVFAAKSMTELLQQHREAPAPPSELVDDIDPRLEHVILQCVRRDPAGRPRSALAVLAALPGGDPLAEALAAGDTPSAELVAAAGGSGSLRARTASAAVTLVALGLLGVSLLGEHVTLFARVPLEKPAVVLADRARDILAACGWSMHGASEAFGFDVYEQYLQEIVARDATPSRWDRLRDARPAAIDFWYRQSPSPLIPTELGGRVTWDDPPYLEPGMAQVRLDPLGRLRELLAVPAARPAAAPSAPAAPSWSRLFALAGLELERFAEAQPTRLPAMFADERRAWSGVYPERPAAHIHVEGAAFAGRPVAFRIIEDDWLDASQSSVKAVLRRGSMVAEVLRGLVQLGCLIGAACLAWVALRQRRTDRRGAFRFAMGMFLLAFAATLLMADHTTDVVAEGRLLMNGLAAALLTAATYWVFYVALEHHVRRIWPETMSSWSRLLAGQPRDPLVGRSLLVGLLLGVTATLLVYLHVMSSLWLGRAQGLPLNVEWPSMQTIMGPRVASGALLDIVVSNTALALSYLMALVLLKLLLRSRRLAALTYGVLQTIIWSLTGQPTIVSWFLFAVLATACTFVVIRIGLLALVLAAITFGMLTSFPMHIPSGNFHGSATTLVYVVVLSIAVFGAVVASRRGSASQALETPHR